MGKPSLIFSGYQYRNHRKFSKLVSWVRVKDKCGKCKGKLKSTLQYEIVSKTSIVAFQSYLEWRLNCITVERELGECLCLYIQFIVTNCQTQGCDMVTTIMLRLDCVKNGETFWVLSKIRKTVRTLYFRRKFHVGQITPAFFESITLMTQQKEFSSSSSLGKIVHIYLEAELNFFF
jgi:hypothetical protein